MITDDEVMRLFERADPARLDDSAPVIDAAGYLDTLRIRSIDVTLTETPPARTGPSSRHRWRIIAAAAAAVVLAVSGAFVFAARDDPAEGPNVVKSTPGASGDLLAWSEQLAWPDPNGGELFTDPVEAARSFVTLITGVTDPPLSEFQPLGPTQGTLDVFHLSEPALRDPANPDRPPHPGSSRVASTITLRQVGGYWFVSGAQSRGDIEITAPTTGQEVTSPLAVEGSAYFEDEITVQLRARTSGAEVLAEDVATGGSVLSSEPFTAELSFDATPTRVGFVLVIDTPDPSSAIPNFTAHVVGLSP